MHPYVATAAYGWQPAAALGDARIAEEARSVVEPVVADLVRANPDLDISTRFPQEEPAHAIHSVADELNAELVVIGSSGRGALPRVVLGSTAADLVRISERPIVVVRGDTERQADDSGVLLGFDGTASSRHILAYAFEYAARHGTPLRAVHGLPGHWAEQMLPRAGSPPESADNPREATVEALGKHLDEWRDRYPGVRADLEVVESTAARALLERTSQATVVVVGSHRHGVARRVLLGSVSHAMLYHADCPVAVIPVPENDEAAKADS
nr:Universal stress protein family [Kibdelosporangium sp. MJ126-NF4]